VVWWVGWKREGVWWVGGACVTSVVGVWVCLVGWKSGWQAGSGCVAFCFGEWQDGVGDVQARGAAFQ
jgi:hypothetical protein